MANKKQSKKTRSSGTPKKKAARKSATAQAKRSTRRAVTAKKVRPAAKKKRTRKSSEKETHSPTPSTLGGKIFVTRNRRKSIGSSSAGQAGDIQGLRRIPIADSESVEELVEEGQAREAAAISGVEDALTPEQGEIRTREAPEDDVPQEYIDEN